MYSTVLFDLHNYSTPAPGYFDEDDVLDFMVHWSTGAWPMYNASQVTSPYTTVTHFCPPKMKHSSCFRSFIYPESDIEREGRECNLAG